MMGCRLGAMWGISRGIVDFFLPMAPTDVPDDLSHRSITTDVRPVTTPFLSEKHIVCPSYTPSLDNVTDTIVE
jgi:hypothetical protein